MTTFLRTVHRTTPPQPPIAFLLSKRNKPSTHLLKTESGLLKARQLLCRVRSSSSSSGRLRARRAMSTQGPGQRPGGGQGWRRTLLHGPGRRAASRVREVWSPRVGSGAGTRCARGSRPPSRAAGAGAAAGRARSLSLAAPGAVRAIAQTRVSHHSEPAKIEADNG